MTEKEMDSFHMQLGRMRFLSSPIMSLMDSLSPIKEPEREEPKMRSRKQAEDYAEMLIKDDDNLPDGPVSLFAVKLIDFMMSQVKEGSFATMRAKAIAPDHNRDDQMRWYYDVITDGEQAWLPSKGTETDTVFLKEVQEIWVTLDGDRGYKCVYPKESENGK